MTKYLPDFGRSLDAHGVSPRPRPGYLLERHPQWIRRPHHVRLARCDEAPRDRPPSAAPAARNIGTGQGRTEGAMGLTPQLQRELGIGRQQ